MEDDTKGGKKPLASKTIIFSLVMGMLAAITTNLYLLDGVLSPSAYGWTMFSFSTVQAVGGVVLRYLTKEPLA